MCLCPSFHATYPILLTGKRVCLYYPTIFHQYRHITAQVPFTLMHVLITTRLTYAHSSPRRNQAVISHQHDNQAGSVVALHQFTVNNDDWVVLSWIGEALELIVRLTFRLEGYKLVSV